MSQVMKSNMWKIIFFKNLENHFGPVAGFIILPSSVVKIFFTPCHLSPRANLIFPYSALHLFNNEIRVSEIAIVLLLESVLGGFSLIPCLPK